MFALALRDYGHAIRFAPDFALALSSKAWLLATSPIAETRNGEEAVRLARIVLSLVDYPEHHDVLAAAYAEAGRFVDAVRAQEVAISRLRTTGRVVLLPEYQFRLDLYRTGRPYHR